MGIENARPAPQLGPNEQPAGAAREPGLARERATAARCTSLAVVNRETHGKGKGASKEIEVQRFEVQRKTSLSFRSYSFGARSSQFFIHSLHLNPSLHSALAIIFSIPRVRKKKDPAPSPSLSTMTKPSKNRRAYTRVDQKADPCSSPLEVLPSPPCLPPSLPPKKRDATIRQSPRDF